MRIEFLPYPFLIGAALIGVVLLGCALFKMRKARLFFLGVFLLYLLLLAGVTLFPMPIPLDMGGAVPRRPVDEIFERVNLLPFKNLWLFGVQPSSFTFEQVGNILLTVPFGLGAPFVTHIRARSMLWMAPALGLAIELSQLAASLVVGFGYRGVDITDVLLNAVGALVGYTAFHLFGWLFRLILRLLRIRPRGLAEYVDRMVRQEEGG